MGSRNDVSHALSQDDLDLACLRLNMQPDFDRQYKIAHQALWPDVRDKSSSELPRLHERIDKCMAHELAGTWWFFPSLYRWWYQIDLKDNQRYLLGALKKLYDGNMQLSLLRPGESAILHTFKSNSAAPFWVYMRSTFMGKSFGALCQLFTLVRNALQPCAPKKPTTSERQDEMKTPLAIPNNELKQPTDTERESIVKIINELIRVVMSSGYTGLLGKKEGCVNSFFSDADPQFCKWQKQYKRLLEHVQQLSVYNLSGIYVNGVSGAIQLERIKSRAEDIQQCAIALGAEYLQNAADRKYGEITEVFKKARKSDKINIEAFANDSRSIIRKFNNRAVTLFDVEDISALTSLRKNQRQRLRQYRTECGRRLVELEVMTPEERAKSIENDDACPFEIIASVCGSIRQAFRCMPEENTPQIKVQLILCLVAQLIQAVQKQAKISDLSGSRGDENLFVWLGHPEIQRDVDDLFRELDMAFGEILQHSEAALSASAVQASTYNNAEALLSLPCEMMIFLKDLRETVKLEGTDPDTNFARALFDKYQVQLAGLKEKGTLFQQQMQEKQFLSELEKIEDIARAALIDQINEFDYSASVMRGILKTYQASVNRAVTTLPLELSTRPDIKFRINEIESAFCQTYKRVNAWFDKYDNELKPFNGDKESFEKLRKSLSHEYHPDTTKKWGEKNKRIANAIFVKFNEWAEQKSAQYIDAEILEKVIPKLWQLETDNVISLMAYVATLKVHAKSQIDLWFDKHYLEIKEDERVKPLRAELQRLMEQAESPNNDAIVLYKAPPEYPEESGPQILSRFTRELYALKYLVENRDDSKLKVNLSDTDKHELLKCIKAADEEVTSLTWSSVNTLKKKEACIERDIKNHKEYITSWRRDIAYYEKREEEYTVTWGQLNRFESYLELLETALNIEPKTCLFGKDTPRKERFTCEVGIPARSAYLMARFKTVTDKIPGESGSRPLGWERVLVKMSQTPDSFYESISYALFAMKHEKACTPEKLKSAVAEYLESNPNDSHVRTYPRRPDDRRPEIWAIVNMLSVAINIDDFAPVVYGDTRICGITFCNLSILTTPVVTIRKTVHSYYYDAVVPVEQFVFQYVTFDKPVEEIQVSNAMSTPGSSYSPSDLSCEDTYTDQTTSNRSSFSSPNSPTKSISSPLTFAYAATTSGQTTSSEGNDNKNAVSVV